MVTNGGENRVPQNSSQDRGSSLIVADNDYLSDDNSPSRHDRLPSAPDADLAMTDATFETETSETEALKQFARAQFGFETCPYFKLSSHVRLPEYATEIGLRDYLTRPPIHRSAPNGPTTHHGVVINIEYDAIHFKTSAVDETLTGSVLHYEIPQALQRQMAAEEEIQADGYTILYAVNNAQLSLLLHHLQKRADGYSSHYDPADTEIVDYEVRDPSTNAIRVETEHCLASPHYMRKITDEYILMAYKALTAPCIMFCVGQKVHKQDSRPEKVEPETPSQGVEVGEDTIVVKAEPADVEKDTEINVTLAKPPLKTKGRKPKKQQTAIEEVKDLQDPRTRDWKFCPYQVCAVFEDKIDRNRELAFDTQLFYYDLPFDELPTQPPSLVRDEAYLEKGQETRGSGTAAPRSTV